MNNLTWIVVACASEAVIYSAFKTNLFKGDAKKITFVSRHHHDASRKKDSELTSDKYGRFNSGTFTEQTDPKRHEEDLFALELARLLTKAHDEKLFRESIIIAPAAFMGMLNRHMPREVDQLAYLKIEKDYTRFTEQELLDHLQEYL